MSETAQHHAYEVMFLVGQAAGAALGETVAHVNDILCRAGGQVIAMRKWDERRLAYEIAKHKRGLYILAYARIPTGGIRQIEHECNLSETILRTLILRADHLTEEEMQAADARQELEVEARLRSEQAAQKRDRGHSRGVSVGAPASAKPDEPAPDAPAASEAPTAPAADSTPAQDKGPEPTRPEPAQSTTEG